MDLGKYLFPNSGLLMEINFDGYSVVTGNVSNKALRISWNPNTDYFSISIP